MIAQIIEGWQINLTIAIDYTESNWDQTDEHSLHFLNERNQYVNSIQSVGAILEFYDYDGMIPVYGFGAIPYFIPYLSDKTSFCFPLTGSFDQPEVKGVAGVVDIYRKTLPQISFSGPTKFAPLLREFRKHILKSEERKAYHVLQLLTDGEIHDFDETREIIVEMSTLPCSIIIIGVGDDYEAFKRMKILDSDGVPLTDAKGNKAARDIVQFVIFKQAVKKGNLAEQVLEEIPE